MKITPWLQQFRQHFRLSSQTTRRRQHASGGRVVEALEDRALLTTVQFDLSDVFNQDSIRNRSAGTDDTIDSPLDGFSRMVTDTFALSQSASGNGLPDNGFFSSNAHHPDVQLGYNNADDGNNVVFLPNPDDSVTIDVPDGNYDTIHVFAAATNGATTMDVIFNYADGAFLARTNPQDWASAITDGSANENATQYNLISGMDFFDVNQSRLFDSNNLSIFGFKFTGTAGEAVDPTRLLQSITIKNSSATSFPNLVVFGATGNNTELVVDTLSSVNDGNFSAGNLSLPEAIEIANGRAGMDTISFAVTGTITLNGQLTSTDDLTIVGPGASDLTISGNNAFRIFQFNSGTVASIEGLTLTDGSSGASGGGAILTFADSLTVSNAIVTNNTTTGSGGGIDGDTATGAIIVNSSTFSNNSATVNNSDGGAIDNQGPLTITDSVFTGNTTGDQGGALWTSGSAIITRSTFSGNQASGSGGAVYNEGGTLTIDSSSFTGNGLLNVDGGAIHTQLGTTTVVRNSLFSGNIAQSGGAIFNDSADMTVVNSTISGNTALAFGGGIWNLTGATIQVTNSTIAFNRADSDGDSIGVGGAFSAFNSPGVFNNTLVTGNVSGAIGADSPDDITADSGAALLVAESSNNLIADAASAGGLSNAVNGNIVGVTVPAILDPQLTSNGGPTQTHALVAGSPAIDAGSNASAVDENGADLTTDQRRSSGGFVRRFNGTTDIGAYEFQNVFTVSVLGDVVNPDDGLVTLREAVNAANANSGQDTINFAVSGTIELTQGELFLTDDVSIQGLGATNLTIDANGDSRVFRVGSGVTATISDLSITGGNASLSDDSDPDWDSLGGGILNDNGTLTVTNTRIHDNSASWGAGINNWRGTLYVSGSTLDGNTASGNGGAIYNWGDGGIAAATVSNSTVSGNSASLGAVMYNWRSSASATFLNTTLVGNSDGLFVNAGNVNLDNSILANNGSEISFGTVTGNNNVIRQPGSAGGLVHGVDGNIVGDGSGSSITIASIVDPVLQDNGGLTPTHALVSGSPAIDAGNNAFLDSLVRPNSVVASTASTDFRPATNLIANSAFTLDNYSTTNDFRGLSDAWITADVNGGTGNDYFANGTPAPVLLFDLPGTQDLTEVIVWGYNVVGAENNDIKDFTLELSTDGGQTFGTPISLTKPRFSESNFVNTLPLGGTFAANFVRMTITDNYFGEAGDTGGDRVAFHEIRFLGQPANDQRGSGFTRRIDGNVDSTTIVDIGAFEFTAPVLTVAISADSISENGGSTTATVSRTGDTSTALTVTLASDDTSEATVPASVTIAAGQTTSPAFTISAVNDGDVDLTQTVTITASAAGTVSGTDTVDVTDDETASLTVAIAAASVAEGGSTTATVTRNGDTSLAVTVTLSSDDTSEATVPASVTIAAGQTTSLPFTITAVDDADVDGTQTATITASATGLTSGTDTVDVTDNENAALTVTIVAASVNEGGATSGTVTRNGDTSLPLTVTLASNDTTEATVPGTVTIAGGQTTSPAFVITAVDDSAIDGTQTATITASATGLTSGSDSVDITDNDVAPRNQQNIGSNPASRSAAPGRTLSVPVVYRTLDPNGNPISLQASLISFNLHFDSTALTFVETTNIFSEGIQVVPDVRRSESDVEVTGDDNDSATDSVLVASYTDDDSQSNLGWPNATLVDGQVLYVAHFTTASDFSGTAINFSANAVGAVVGQSVDFEFSSEPVTVSLNENPGNVDGDSDFDANDAFLIQLVQLAGSNAQIDQSKGASTLPAAEIRDNIAAIGLGGDVDGDNDFDANDSFLIQLVKLAGSNAQIDQSKGASRLTADQIRANVNNLGSSSGQQATASSALRLAAVSAEPERLHTQLFDQMPTGSVNEEHSLVSVDVTDSNEVWTDFRSWIDAL